jgi:hypothetical protein
MNGKRIPFAIWRVYRLRSLRNVGHGKVFAQVGDEHCGTDRPRPFTMLRAGPGSNRRAGIDKLVASRTVAQW